jgi:hypothetical protein
MSRTHRTPYLGYLLTVLFLSLQLTACGGGGGGSDTTANAGTNTNGAVGASNTTPSAGSGSTTPPVAGATDPASSGATTPPDGSTTTPPTAGATTPPIAGTAEKSWRGAQIIDNAPGFVSSGRVVFNGRGTALAIWAEGENLYARNFSITGGWESAQLLGTGNAGVHRKIELVADHHGNALVLWGQKDGAAVNLYITRYTPQGGWGAAELLETNLSSDFAVDLAVDNNGNAIATWTDYRNRDELRDISGYAKSYTPTSGWGPRYVIEDRLIYEFPSTTFPPDIAFDGNGNAMAVWGGMGMGVAGIYARRYTQVGGWEAPQLIQTGFSIINPKMALDRSGNAIAVWEQDRKHIYANRFTPTGGWGTAQLIGSADGVEALSALSPKIGIDSNGNALAVWLQRDRQLTTIQTNRYSPASGWGTAQQLAVGLPNMNFDLAVSANGDAMATWRSNVYESVRVSRFTPASGWGAAQPISSASFDFLELPLVAIDVDGNALALWVRGTSAASRLYANRFD